MRVGILKTGSAPPRLAAEQGDYDARMRWLLGEDDYSFRTYDVQGGELPGSHEEADGWIITGSRHGVYESHTWIAPLEAFIRLLSSHSPPLIGICFGHQIIAQALGGVVETSAVGRIVGSQVYRRENGRSFRANAWHTDHVVSPPPIATVLASSESCRYAALHYPGFALTVQPHPEFTSAYYAGLFEERAHGLPEDRREAARLEILNGIAEDPYLVQLLRAFMRSRGTQLIT